MTLTPGTRLGPYEVTAPIGEGGMGEVYRARDSKLKREVALKVLPAAFAADAERMARFQREAELLASLNHPNIATIHGVEAGALVMELVDGENLRGPLALTDALPLAKQIAEALEYAHERGIVHRDLKPANVKVTSDGVVKLLDFGLAKAVEDPFASNDLANSPTLTLGATRAGIILGTAAYMSPEQAHGKPADRRADIWSFGAVFFEMLTGKPMFSGESVSDTLASVLKVDPDWTQLPRDTPSAIRTLLQRCLTRDRKQRLQAIGEARIVLDDAIAGKAIDPTAARPTARAAWRTRAGWIAAGVFAAIAAGTIWYAFRPASSPSPPVVRFRDALRVVNAPGSIAFSRDGSVMAYVGGARAQIHVRRMDGFESDVLSGTEEAAFLSFSPDGRSISFISPLARAADRASKLKKVSLDGGPVQTLADAPSTVGPPTAVWEDDNTIFFMADGVLNRIPSTGGKAVVVAAPEPNANERYYVGPQLLPDRRHLIVSLNMQAGVGLLSHRLITIDLQTGEKTTLLEQVGVSRYLPTEKETDRGHLVYYDPSAAVLMAVPFNASRRLVEGTPTPVLEGVANSRGPFGTFGISNTGMLMYVAGAAGSSSESRLVWVARDGTEEPLKLPPRRYNSIRLSPDGQRIAASIPENNTEYIWLLDIARGSQQRLTVEGFSGNPVWTPDGSRLFYERRPASSAAVMTVPADASASPAVVLKWDRGAIGPTSVSPDGRLLIGSYPTVRGLWVMPVADALAGKADVQPFLEVGVSRLSGTFSPDGRWIAYASTESGTSEIYVVAFPGPGAKIPISVGGGTTARWARSGREIFYRAGDKTMAVQVETAPRLRAAAPTQLFEGRYGGSWDVDVNDRRLLMVKLPPVQRSETDQLNVVLNWFDELRRRVPFPSQ
jgi:hypothetical protein